jgi:hypothetical protein
MLLALLVGQDSHVKLCLRVLARRAVHSVDHGLSLRHVLLECRIGAQPVTIAAQSASIPIFFIMFMGVFCWLVYWLVKMPGGNVLKEETTNITGV